MPAAATTLIATVGLPNDPEAFEIALTTTSGAPVTTLPAGRYLIQVRDLANTHNFRLTGPGVDRATAVFAKENVTFDVTLRAGTYRYLCDPHPGSMNGSITVT